MAKLYTLTVPDVLWINLRVTGAPQSGPNHDLAGQAARFLTGFRRLAPFSEGNEATAFVGCLAFLEMNGRSVALGDDEALKWLESLCSGREPARAAIEARLGETGGHVKYGVPESHTIVEGILACYPKALAGLVSAVA
jgi:hypothetical protein